jgi:hypothetical protein
MSDVFALPLEISAKIIREHLADGSITCRLITEGLQGSEQTGPDDNDYVLNLREGFKAPLDGPNLDLSIPEWFR